MITLTTEQAQQIEESLSDWKEYDAWTDQQMWNNDDEKALPTIRAARAQEQAEQDLVEKEIAAAVLDHCYGHSAVNDDMIERTSVVVKKILDKHAAPQPVKQEPVAYVYEKDVAGIGMRKDVAFTKHVEVGTDLYAAPVRTKDPCHPWQDLTDDEIAEITKDFGSSEYRINRIMCARAVIAADREKNK